MIGRSLGHYTVLSSLGSGGMGEVYVAQDTKLGRRVALKVLPSEVSRSVERRRRFETEARAVAALSHPNVVAIHDFGEDDGVVYAVMELLEGTTLRQKLESGPLPLDTALRLAREAVAGLEAAHGAGIVHRDLKPENLYVTVSGQLKILDFGLVKHTSPDASPDDTPTDVRNTEQGAILGTVGYMSPEQVRAQPVDARSDVFSLGAVLYEMLTGERAFPGSSSGEVMSAILRDEPPAMTRSTAEIPGSVAKILERCLAKSPDERFPTTRELRLALEDVLASPVSGSRRRLAGSRRTWIAAASVLLGILVLGWSLHRRERLRWAREEALPEVTRLAGSEAHIPAYELALQVQPLLGDDPELVELWARFSRPISIESEPGGAEVTFREYGNPQSEWALQTTTPARDFPIPRVALQIRVHKEGFRAAEDVIPRMTYQGPQTYEFALAHEGSESSDMVRVFGGDFRLMVPGLDHLEPVHIDDYWIDRFEVTNRRFKEFVDDGGYTNPVYWVQPIEGSEEPLSWQESRARFRDKTGRPGPATWELGDFPEGQDDYPVSGVSWYEAAAFAEWAGQSLPTIYHWNRVAQTWMSQYIVPLSNFGTDGLAPVGRYQGMSGAGTYDMAGNVREWCSNVTSDGWRFVMGGAWDDPQYAFFDYNALDPMDRSPGNGFRLVRSDEGDGIDPGTPAAASVELPSRDFRTEEPASEEVFGIYRRLYDYDPTVLNARVESRDETSADWIQETITFDAAYEGERVLAHLFLPKKREPPYQVVIYFPGSGAIQARSSKDLDWRWFDFVPASGRALLVPVYKGTYERGTTLPDDNPRETVSYREHVIAWAKDFRRSIDYLESRDDIDKDRIGYLGLSWGATMGGIMLAVDDRIKAGVLHAGGFYFLPSFPEVDPLHFFPRVRVPVLMLNGRHDVFFPVETSQAPMFRVLGTPQEHKRHLVYDADHLVPRIELIKETLDWFDRYLGPAD